MSNHLILLLTLFHLSLFSQSVDSLAAQNSSISLAGTYTSSSNTKIEINKDGTFRAWISDGLGGMPTQPSTIGKWSISADNKLVTLTSHKLPQISKSKRDSTLSGYTIALKSEDITDYRFVEATIHYLDTVVVSSFDSIGVIKLNETPRLIKVEGLGLFTYLHYYSDFYSQKEIRSEQRSHDDYSPGIIRSFAGNRTNYLEIFLEEKFLYYNHKTFYYDGDLFPLRSPLSRE